MRHPKPTPEQNAGRLVRKAAQVLKDKKWIQGAIGNEKVGYCAIGVIHRAVVTAPQLASDSIEEFNSWLNSNHGVTIGLFNDTPGRTKEEVIQMMEKFADEYDPKRR